MDPFTQAKSAEHMVKSKTKSISNRVHSSPRMAIVFETLHLQSTEKHRSVILQVKRELNRSHWSKSAQKPAYGSMPLEPARTRPRSNFPGSKVAFPRYNELSSTPTKRFYGWQFNHAITFL